VRTSHSSPALISTGSDSESSLLIGYFPVGVSKRHSFNHFQIGRKKGGFDRVRLGPFFKFRFCAVNWVSEGFPRMYRNLQLNNALAVFRRSLARYFVMGG